MFAAIKNIFPMRPLRINYAGMPSGNLAIFIGFLGSVLLLISGYCLAPGIFNDFKVSQSREIQRTPLTQVPRGFDCVRDLGIVMLCYGDFKVESDGTVYGRYHMDLWFDFAREETYSVTALSIAGQPETMTIGVAVEKIWNRIFILIGLVLIALVLFYCTWRQVLQARIGYQLTAYKNMLRPVVLTLSKEGKKRRFQIYKARFTHPESGKKMTANLRMRHSEHVFMLDASQRQALGVIAKGIDLPVLMDDKLLRIDFDDDERAAIFAAIGRETPGLI